MKSEKNQRMFSENQLKIPGYDLLFPASWSSQGHARVLMYFKSTLEYERLEDIEHDSVQSIWIRGGFKNGMKIIFCHSYREHTNCLGSSLHAQKGCLDTFLHQWDLASQIKTGDEPNEIHICGDINLDAYLEKWLSPSYYLYSLSKMVQTACTLGNFTQLVKVPTRFQFNRVTGQTSISCLDHVYIPIINSVAQM